jgi:hypothetical protein
MMQHISIQHTEQEDDKQSGLKSLVATVVNTAHSVKLIQMHRCVTLWCIAYYLVLSTGTGQNITAGELQNHQSVSCVNRQHSGKNDGLCDFPEHHAAHRTVPGD